MTPYMYLLIGLGVIALVFVSALVVYLVQKGSAKRKNAENLPDGNYSNDFTDFISSELKR